MSVIRNITLVLCAALPKSPLLSEALSPETTIPQLTALECGPVGCVDMLTKGRDWVNRASVGYAVYRMLKLWHLPVYRQCPRERVHLIHQVLLPHCLPPMTKRVRGKLPVQPVHFLIQHCSETAKFARHLSRGRLSLIPQGKSQRSSKS